MKKRLKIYKFDSPKLKVKCKEVEEITPDLLILIKEMKLLCLENKGLGLAAPQVGKTDAVFVMRTFFEGQMRQLLQAVINPRILDESERSISTEGCLSFPGVLKQVERYNTIKVEYIDETGKLIEEVLTGFPAVIFLHELDHVNGVTLNDY